MDFYAFRNTFFHELDCHHGVVSISELKTYNFSRFDMFFVPTLIDGAIQQYISMGHNFCYFARIFTNRVCNESLS